jgi:hypothetical protein
LQEVLLSRIAKLVKKNAIQDSKKMYIVYPGCTKCSYPGLLSRIAGNKNTKHIVEHNVPTLFTI